MLKRKVLSLTKPKGKIYKTKSLGHYITQRTNTALQQKSFSIYKKWNVLQSFCIQIFYTSGKFCQRPSVIRLKLTLSFIFNTQSSVVQGDLKWWLCLFFFSASYLDSFPTFSTQAVCYKAILNSGYVVFFFTASYLDSFLTFFTHGCLVQGQ